MFLQMIKNPYEAYLDINSFIHETQIYPCELDSHHLHKDKHTITHTNSLVTPMRDYYSTTI